MEIARFFSHIAIQENGCWLWTGSTRTNGGGQKYGRTWDKGRGISAHRKSYQLAFGSIPTGLHILHKCDTPLCVNPQHLFAGTPKDNMQDCKEKGRLADPGGHFFDGHRGKSGSANSQAKLTEAQVKEIRQLYAQGVGQHALAAQYHTTNTNISLIVLRRTWKGVA